MIDDMKTIRLILLGILFSFSYQVNAQFVAKVEVKEHIEGLCDSTEVYALFPGFTGQEEAKCTVTEDSMRSAIEQLEFLQANPKFKGEGMAQFIVNCKGEVVKCDIDNSSGDTEFDRQIVELLKTYTQWQPGKLNDKKVDSIQFVSFKVAKGKVKPR
ncbi:MAG: hypothetical protein GC181_08870 [Bacteroidetes bacterium]|nr:hypothetical protein [Bacteroidota bacterium]